MKNKGGKRINQNSHKWPWALVAALAQFTTRVCRDTESIPTASPWNHTKQTVPSPARDTRDWDPRGGRRFTGLKRAGTTGQSLLFHDIQNPWQPKIQGTGNQVPRLVLAWGLLHSSLQLPSSKGKFSNTAKHKVKPKTGCPHLLSHQTLKGISLSISSSQHCILSVISAGPDKGWTPGCWNKHSCRERAVRGTGQLGKVGRELLCCWISAGNRTADTLTTEQVSTLSHVSPYTYIYIYIFQDIQAALLFPGGHPSPTESTSAIPKLDWPVPFSWTSDIRSCPTSQLSATGGHQQPTPVDKSHSAGGWRDRRDSASCIPGPVVPGMWPLGTNQPQLSSSEVKPHYLGKKLQIAFRNPHGTAVFPQGQGASPHSDHVSAQKTENKTEGITDAAQSLHC